MTEIQELLEIAIRAVIAGGKEIMTIYEHFDGKVEYKSDDSPLTIADKNAHKVIKAILDKTNIPVLSEEGKNIHFSERKDWDYFWLVDPLDGTKEFIKHNDEFTVNIALIHQGVPIAGAVLLPVKGQIYFADVTQPVAYFRQLDNLDNLPEDIYNTAILLPEKQDSKVFKVVASRSHLNNDTKEFIANLKTEHKNIEIISAGSSLKICLVAHGKADIYPRFGPTMEWDTAAGHAIVLGASKKIVKPDGSSIIYNKEDLYNPYFIVK